MKAFLMFRDSDFSPRQELGPGEEDLVKDLELDVLFGAMATDDKFLTGVVRAAVLDSLKDLDAVRYRQRVLKDCLDNPALIREMYDTAVDAIQSEKKVYFGFLNRYPGAILSRSVQVMRLLLIRLKKLRSIADEHGDEFESDGFKRLFSMFKDELSDEYFEVIEDHLRELHRDGALISSKLGTGNKGTNYLLLRQDPGNRRGWLSRFFGKSGSEFTITLSDRDESGARALSEMRDRGINSVADALAQSTDHVLSFFNAFRTELGFYAGCLNLHDRLAQREEPICFPVPLNLGQHAYSFRGLYDPCLVLKQTGAVVGNDLKAEEADLVVITGANRGGKSTFLRGLGLAQLMMQAGMFVPAETFSSDVCDGLFTHFKREEDAAMKSGKLDEELVRMSDIVDELTKDSLLLFNESFAATNEREGSEIARQIVTALVESGTKVLYVTHLHEFARDLYEERSENAVFLRAERRDDGERTFKIVEDEPLPTSFGKDLYDRIFEPGGEVSEGSLR